MSSITNVIGAITASTSGCGTDCAGRIRALASLPLAALALGAASPGVPSPSANLRVQVEGLRGHKGLLRFCLTRMPNYMKCDDDHSAVRLSVSAAIGAVTFEDMAPGQWSLLLIHDSNANGKLDTRFGIPREGFGFSGNPAIGFGPPSPVSVRFALPSGSSHQSVKVRYLL